MTLSCNTAEMDVDTCLNIGVWAKRTLNLYDTVAVSRGNFLNYFGAKSEIEKTEIQMHKNIIWRSQFCTSAFLRFFHGKAR